MKGYLHVRTGCQGLLLPVEGVLEVLEVDRAEVTAGHAPWRDTSLPVVEGHALLDERAAEISPCAAVVYAPAPDVPPSMILVDRVAGLLSGADTAPLSRAPAAAARLFEATAAAGNGERLYCLRRPLAQLSTGLIPAMPATEMDAAP